MSKTLTARDLMDAMRALAAIIVLFSHDRIVLFDDATPGLSFPWKIFYLLTGLGHQAVMVFFVLSGYWITGSVARRYKTDGFKWVDYAVDRVCRLWIVLFPALIIGGILDYIGRYVLSAPIYHGIQGTNILTFDVGDHLSPICFAGNLAFVQTLLVAPFGSNGSLWSLANEFWYYLWFPPLYQLLRGRVSSPLMLIVALGSMCMFRTLIPGYICWLFGSILFYATDRPEARPEARPGAGAVVGSGLAFLLILVATKLPGLRINETVADIFVSGSFALFLYMLIRYPGKYSPWLAPLCRYGARSSYSLYAIHLPLVVMMAAAFLTPARRLPPSASPLMGFAAIALITIGCAHLFSLATEANTSALRIWLKRKHGRFSRAAI